MILKWSFKFSYSFLTSCEHVPQPRWLLPHLQSNIIRQNKATECFRCAHLGLQKAADCASTPQKKLTKDWILWSVFQTGQSKLFSHRVILLNSAPFLQLIAGITFIFLCYLEIHVWSLFSPLKESKSLSSQMESLHPELVYKGSCMITSDTGRCSNKEPHSLSRRHYFPIWWSLAPSNNSFSTQECQIQLCSSTVLLFLNLCKVHQVCIKYCNCQSMRKRALLSQRSALFRHGQL